MTAINLVYRMRPCIIARGARFTIDCARHVLSSFICKFQVSWRSYTIIRERLVISTLFDEFMARSADGSPINCLCCGGRMFLSKEWNEITGSCGHSTPPARCPSYHDKGHGMCTIHDCAKFTASVIHDRDRWIVFKSWIVIKEIQRHGWCILSDVRADIEDVTAIIASIFPARVHLLDADAIDVLVSLPGVAIPNKKLSSIKKRNGCLVSITMHPVDDSRDVLQSFIKKARMALKSRSRIDDLFPVWNAASIIMP